MSDPRKHTQGACGAQFTNLIYQGQWTQDQMKT